MARKRVKKSACARLIRFLKEHRNKRSKIMSDKRWREYDRDSKKMSAELDRCICQAKRENRELTREEFLEPYEKLWAKYPERFSFHFAKARAWRERRRKEEERESEEREKNREKEQQNHSG